MIIVYFLLVKDKDRNLLGWLPENRVKTGLLEGEMEFTKISECKLECLGFEKDTIPSLIDESDVEFNKSKVRVVPKNYILALENNKIKQLSFDQYDDLIVLKDVILNDQNNCQCQ
jgi:hypothetical protein